MKGQKLFVRTETSDDAEELSQFYSNEGTTPPDLNDPGSNRGALLGKLVGNIAAHLTYSRDGSVVRIHSIHVARLLRRKRIGRFMISELERHEAHAGASRIETSAACEASAFLRAIGFVESPEAQTLVRSITTEEDP